MRVMKALFLGTGTSVGVPVIACDCPVCLSDNPANKRRRTSLYVETDENFILIDCATDFREQALQYRLPRIDAVLFTHAHADHIFGFDDIRRYNTIQKSVIPAYADGATLADLQRIFDYVSATKVKGLYRPQIEWKEITDPFSIGTTRITPLPVEHGPKGAIGFLLEENGKRLAYIPDCKSIPASTMKKLVDIDVMILDALRKREHRTHMTLDESVRLLSQIGAPRSFTVHMCHDLDHEVLESTLPSGIKPAHDGLSIDI
jgi:phosphoribosyl 1,2-cyclic phosphate phosphodiesterase